MAKGLKLPIETAATMCEVRCVGMGSEVRLREKTAPDGRPTYSSGTILMVEGKDGAVSANKTASVNVIEAPHEPFQLGAMYRAEGKIWIMPYESNGRVTLSVTVEKLVSVLTQSDRKAAA